MAHFQNGVSVLGRILERGIKNWPISRTGYIFQGNVFQNGVPIWSPGRRIPTQVPPPGNHHGLNRRAQGKSQIPFYLLMELLFKEAKLTSLQICLVSERMLKRIQRRQYLNIQARLFDAWEKARLDFQVKLIRIFKDCHYLVLEKKLRRIQC